MVNESNDNTKICPYCGEQIKANAIKCKHCKSFLQEESIQEHTAPSVSKNNTNTIIGAIIACIVIFLVILIGSTELEEDIDSSESISSDSQSELNITGKYSGFGGSREFAYSLDGDEKCVTKAVGKSLVKGIIASIENSTPNSLPELYSISRYNPHLKFEVTNPTPVYDPYIFHCKADLIFKNYKPDTIAGYTGYGQNAEPYTLDNAHFTVKYTTSKLGDKYKVNVGRIQGYSLEGYED